MRSVCRTRLSSARTTRACVRGCRPVRTGHLALVGLVLAALASQGCKEKIEAAVPRPESARVTGFELNAPRILRGTIASEAVLLGYSDATSPRYRPVVVWGYGLVVGLAGTGSRDLPPALRANMLAEMTRQGIGSERLGYGHLNAEQMLDSEDTAVVIVEAIVPQGANEGTRFDVRVFADPRTGTTSLDGGRLYTAELRQRQPGEVLPALGSAQSFVLATATGPIFINPFAEPGAGGRDTINRSSGRILDGGVVTDDMPIKLRLAQPSHRRATVIQSAVNAQFPQERGQRLATARGESADLVALTVPPSYRDRTAEFVELLLHTTIRRTGVESIAASVRRVMLADPATAVDASWRWQALGPRALPVIRDLYDHPEQLPRLAALRAGARLGDALVFPHLVDMAESGDADNRLDAIDLLASLPAEPQIDRALRKFLNDEDSELRLRTYEALVDRDDPYLRRYVVDGKFVLDVVDSDIPMIYITQIGQPRIVLFGDRLALDRPITVQAWSNRLMVKGDQTDELVEVYYREHETDLGMITMVEPTLEHFIQFLGHTTTVDDPAPGLGLSYGEAVGAIHQIWSQKYIKADFRAEQDRILAAILRNSREAPVVDRPEFTEPPAGSFVPGVDDGIDGADGTAPEGERPLFGDVEFDRRDADVPTAPDAPDAPDEPDEP